MEGQFGADGEKRSLYLKQIWYLEDQFERWQLNHDELEKQNKDLTSQRKALEKEAEAITEPLRRSLTVKEKKVDELLEQLESEAQAAKQEREALELQDSLQKLVYLRDNKSKNMRQAAKLEEQKEQKEQLRQHVSHKESLEKQLVSEKEEHEAAVHRMKTDHEPRMERRVKALQQIEERCVKLEASKSLQKERNLYSRWLQDLPMLQSECDILQEETGALRLRDREACLKLRDMKQEHNELTQQRSILKKDVKRLTEELQGVTAKFETEALSQRLVLASKEHRQKAAKVVQLQAEQPEERSSRRQAEGVKQEAAIILRHILSDSGDTEWKMERLLVVVDSTAPDQGPPSKEQRSVEKSSQRQKPQTSGCKPVRRRKL